MKILVVEDDININNLLVEALTKENYECESAYSGTECLMLFEKNCYSLIILDLMLPGLSGEQVIAKIRESSNVPVIVITAKDTIDEKVDILKNGADDYITKPFNMKEVLARVEVCLRRNATDGEKKVLSYNELVLDITNHTVTVGGRELNKITKQEFAILQLLMSNPKQIFSREAIFTYAWSQEYMGETKTLDVHISNIRKKIKDYSNREYIETIWGIGYRLMQ